MGKKRLWIVAVAASAALVVAGVAIASKKAGAVQSTGATFDATTVTSSTQKTCTVNGGDTYTYTRATYTGTATSADPRLNGPLTVRAASLVDSTTGVGALVGKFQITGSTAGTGAHGALEAAVNNAQASGLARGVANGPQGRLIASLGSAFTASGGFAGGSLGTGAVTGSGTVLSGGECVRTLPHHGSKVKLKLGLDFF